jgi:hypothetical protein
MQAEQQTMSTIATSDEDIQDKEEHFEQAAVSLLLALDVPAYGSTSGQELPDVSVEVMFEDGDGLEQSPINGEWTQFSARFSFLVTSERMGDADRIGESKAMHRACIRKIRALLMKKRQAFNQTTLPYYRITHLQPKGAARDIVRADNIDKTMMVYDIEYEMIPGSFPA